jgi:hypothetical protein
MCAAGGRPAATSLPAPWSTIEVGALVLYNATWRGFLPADLDGFVAVLAPKPERILGALGRGSPPILARPPGDGGASVPLQLGPMFPGIGLLRRGTLLAATSGPTGKARVADLAVRDGAPLLRLFVDVARIRARLPGAGAEPADDGAFFTASGGEEGTPLAGLFGTVELVGEVAGRDARVRLTVDVPPPQRRTPAPAADPRDEVRRQCRAILRKSFTAAAPSLAKLGVTTDLDAIAETYTTSIEADRAVRSCAKLSAAARACLEGAADPIAEAPRCAPGNVYRESELELPPLFSFFGPRPLEARLHPAIDGSALRKSLVGTWVHKDSWGRTETWKIDAAGGVIITNEDPEEPVETERYRLEVKAAGEIELRTDRDGSHQRSLFMPAPDRFHSGGDATPIADEARFVAPLGDGFLVREPAGCSVVTREGALVAARCEVRTDAGARTLRIEHAPPCRKDPRDPRAPKDCSRVDSLRFFPGWVVSKGMAERVFVRRR